ncbi:TPR-like protein [Phlebopus sp. FC_14]|nr:TPR-like protein [Phlebopus sp. FC_14]
MAVHTVENYRVALERCRTQASDSSPDSEVARLASRARSLIRDFLQQGALADLQEAIALLRSALALCPFDHHDRPVLLNDLANCLQNKFKHQGLVVDLDQAIEFHQSALALWALGDFDESDRFMSLNNLATCLQDRFKERGALADLDKAIDLHHSALLVCPSGDKSDHYMSLNNLATALRSRFKLKGVLADLDEAIELHRSTLTAYPDQSDRFMSLSNVANCIHDRFEQQGILADLNQAIELHRSALLLCPSHHSDRSISLNSLANCLGHRFKEQGDLADLNEAIELHRSVLILRPAGHVDRSMTLNNLAICLRDRSVELAAPADLDEAIHHHRSALALRPVGHALRSRSLHNLAFCLQDRFEWQCVMADLDEAIELLRSALSLHPLASRDDIFAAKTWVISAEVFKHDSGLNAYQTALRLLVQHLATLPSSPEHFDLLKYTASSLSVDAFSYCIRHGALNTAVELLEQGRAVFWAQSARLRTPLDELAADDDGKALAEEFNRLRYLIRRAAETTSELQSDEISHLTIQLDGVVSRIRMLPNFPRFLLPPLFSDLQKAAKGGPVIIVNASEYSCDALIILPERSANPICIRLNMTQAQVHKLSSDFKLQTRPVNFDAKRMVKLLRNLWARVVEPVASALQTHGIQHGSRIWWCPTSDFSLLPLHAAGLYKSGKPNLFNLYISSYTPTLAALVRARQNASQDSGNQTKCVLGVGLTQAHRGSALPSAVTELASVAKALSPVSSFTSLTEGDATTDKVTDALGRSQWLHLACHGIPNRKQPFESSFALRDGPLTVKKIIQCELQNPEFAFLSACHTMVGDESSPDEAIHLAAAVQFAGFKSVIGTMWSVDDAVVGDIVSAFYDNLIDCSGGKLEYTNAAIALHRAVRKWWKTIPFDQRIVFVHVGA